VDIVLIINILKSIILGLIQGTTEFLPVSSTGHMIVFGKLLEMKGEFATVFEVFIQLGATSALMWYFRKDLWKRSLDFFRPNGNRKLIYFLLVAFIPVGIIGLLFHNNIEVLLDSALAVGIAQILGGSLILFAEHKSKHYKQKTNSLNNISFKQALAVGIWQIVALWPGMSRSGSTIMGGLLSKIDRPTATKFSFYLSIPVSISSSFFILAKHHEEALKISNVIFLCVGFISAFLMGLLIVKFIMQYILAHSFVIFAYYRFFLGALIIFLVTRNIL